MIRGVVAGLAAGGLWGLVFVAPQIAPGLSAIDLAGGRFVSYAAMAVLVMLLRGKTAPRPTLHQAAVVLGLSVLGFSGYYLLLVLAIRDMGVEVPTLIIGTIPIWVMVLGKPQGLLWRALLPGLLLTAAGVVLMSIAGRNGASFHWDASSTYWRGLVYALLAMAFWTTFALLNSAWLQKHREVNVTAWANWLGVASGLSSLAVWWWLGTDWETLRSMDGFGTAVGICVLAGAGSAWFATVLWNYASRRLSASLCGQLIVSETLFALLYAFLWNGNWPRTLQWVASGLFVLGISASIRAHR